MSGKYCISVDLEGVACVVGAYGQGLAEGTKGYAYAVKQGTREAASAAKALFDSGADEVLIWDCHGSGVNLDYDKFDPRCRFALGAGSRIRFPGVDESFDGVLFIGYHAYDTPKATLAHAYSSSTFVSHKINGKEIGELQLDAAIAGKRGVKTIFVSSDNVCVEQAKETFPWAKTVVTKDCLAWNNCISRHPQTVCDDIYNSVKSAVANINDMKPYVIKTPFELSVTYKRIEYAQGCSLRNPDNTPFETVDAYTRKGILADPEHYFQF
ncbi:MAG: M55 family metallopeptidase [Clostridia bacterium]|nr:M55 family metallopeptidase [Clostridia bacterium]